MGGTLGTVVTWSLTGPLLEKFGWTTAFYVPAALTLVWCGLWWYLVADTPAEHPRISDQERKYILEALGDRVKSSKVSKYLIACDHVLANMHNFNSMVLVLDASVTNVYNTFDGHDFSTQL